MNKGRTPESAGPLGPAIRLFDFALRPEGNAAKTRRTCCEAAAWIAIRNPGLADWSQFTRANIREHFAYLHDHYSAAYSSIQHRALQQFFKWLSDEDGIPNRWPA